VVANRSTITLSGFRIPFKKMRLGNERRLTQRALDWWESARFQAVCVA